MLKRKKNILGVIGLRSGSKGIKDKNIKTFDGNPLFVKILNTAHNSKYLTRTIVSTDSNKYAKLVKKNTILFIIYLPRKDLILYLVTQIK